MAPLTIRSASAGQRRGYRYLSSKPRCNVRREDCGPRREGATAPIPIPIPIPIPGQGASSQEVAMAAAPSP